MPSTSNKSELLPIARHKPPKDESLQFLWAVSYSDLLMVLMSFFIIFFEKTDSESQTSYNLVVTSLKSQITEKKEAEVARRLAAAVVPQVPNPASKSEQPPTPLDLSQITRALDANKIPFRTPGGKSDLILIDLPNNLYGAGQYTLSNTAQLKLITLLKIIQHLQGQVQLTFIGHSDKAPLMALLRQSAINSNLALSNLRGSRAVEIALKLGFDPKHVISQGSGEYVRNTRSLSIRVSRLEQP